MKKLMNNSVLKLILCTGFVYGTSFGMEQKPRGLTMNDPKKNQEYRLQQRRVRDATDCEKCVEGCVRLSACIMCPVFLFGALALRAANDDQFARR
jgi:hypothetical protein